MPRGLGDDPLSRKRSRRSPTNEVMDESGAQSRPVVVISGTSHNDVFFRKRTEEPRAIPEKQAEGPEIHEVNDILRIAEVASSTQTGHATESSQVTAPASPIDSQPQMVEEPAAVPELPSPMPEEPSPSQSEVSNDPRNDHQERGGFFRRLFGRRGK